MNVDDTSNIYFVKFVAVLILPFAIWALVAIGYVVARFVRRKKLKNQIFAKNLMVFFMIIAFILQPNIVQQCLEIFK